VPYTPLPPPAPGGEPSCDIIWWVKISNKEREKGRRCERKRKDKKKQLKIVAYGKSRIPVRKEGQNTDVAVGQEEKIRFQKKKKKTDPQPQDTVSHLNEKQVDTSSLDIEGHLGHEA
jgi:hypothetical protein